MCGHYKIGLKIASGAFRDIKGTNNIFHIIKNAKKSTKYCKELKLPDFLY